MCGKMTEEEFDAIAHDNDAERAKITHEIEDLQQQVDALNPDADVLERLGDDAISMEPEQENVLMKRLLRKITVTKDEISVEPRHGISWVYDRRSSASVTPS